MGLIAEVSAAYALEGPLTCLPNGAMRVRETDGTLSPASTNQKDQSSTISL